MKTKKAIFALGLLALLSITLLLFPFLRMSLQSCAFVAPPPIDPPTVFDADKAYTEVKDFCELGPRVSGTEGAKRAALYLANRLTELGVPSEIDEFQDRSVGQKCIFRNVIGTLKGKSNAFIILASHYDTKSGIDDQFTGANDSGSSTGLLLELARTLAKLPEPECGFIFVFFDGEECVRNYSASDGLHGSRRMAETLVRNGTAGNIRAVIILDMIGDKDLTVTIPKNSTPELKSLAFEAAHEAGVRNKFSLYRTAILDDHVPSLRKGIPAIDIIDFEFGSAPGRNDYWHTDQDTLDKISPASLKAIGSVTLIMLKKLSLSS